MALLAASRWTPLFKPGWGRWDHGHPTNVVVDTNYFDGPSWIFDLYARDTGGSDVAADPVKRAQLLAEAIPALSLPVGANETASLPSGRNHNMTAQYADQTHWPRGNKDPFEIPDWRHSDIREVSYLYLHRFYHQLVTISNQ